MEIHWKSFGKNPLQRINLEYAVQLQVRMALIKEAEHLMDYLSLVVVEVCSDKETAVIGKDTPEPLYSILEKSIGQHTPIEKDSKQGKNTALEAFFQPLEPVSV